LSSVRAEPNSVLCPEEAVLCVCLYASGDNQLLSSPQLWVCPQIMMMIKRVSGIEFLKDHDITELKPQFPAAPIITKDVSSTSASPRSTHSSLAAPPSAPLASSSSGGVLRVLKDMFAWCRDTHQRQDMLLSNQRHQNEKLGIDEFDMFSLLLPPLDDDPFCFSFHCQPCGYGGCPQ
jgi:hypothetical protein